MTENMALYILPALLRLAVEGEGERLEIGDWPALLRLAGFHQVEPLVWRAVEKAGLDAPEEVRRALKGARDRALFREAQQSHTAGALRQALTEAGVPHVLLRGAVMRGDYPVPALRTMADLDYLVRVEDYPKIKKAAEALGGEHVHTDGGHFSFTLPPSVAVEFHPDLIYTASPVGTYINPGWQYVRRDSGPFALELTEEGFYLNMVCHLAYHMAKGGAGVRSILDLWVYRSRHALQPDAAFVEGELERAGLLAFARKAEALAAAWFGGGAMTPELEELGRYILTSGAHGTQRRAVLNAACFSKGGTGASALLERAFYPRRELENRFPWLRGRPWLLPAAWCARALRAVGRHGGHVRRWSQAAGQLTPEELAEQRAKLRQFGFQLGERNERT